MSGIITSLIYVFTSCVMLFLSKIAFDKFSPFKPEEQLKENNPTPIIAFVGYLVGVTFILVGAYVGPAASSFKLDILLYIAYALLGIVLMTLTGFLVNKVMLNKFNNTKEMLQDRNIGTAAVHFGIYIASGLIISACVNGEYGGLLSSIIYYILGMLFLFVFLRIYDVITPYSIHDELEKDNYAVGIALAGNIIAIGLILMKATLGDVVGWKSNIILYLIDLASILLLLPAVRYILGNIIIRKININKELKNNNVAAALIEFSAITCFALIIFFMVDFTFIF